MLNKKRLVNDCHVVKILEGNALLCNFNSLGKYNMFDCIQRIHMNCASEFQENTSIYEEVIGRDTCYT